LNRITVGLKRKYILCFLSLQDSLNRITVGLKQSVAAVPSTSIHSLNRITVGLKLQRPPSTKQVIECLNRITVGLKRDMNRFDKQSPRCLNRITVGLKHSRALPSAAAFAAVWIESRWDWNILKPGSSKRPSTQFESNHGGIETGKFPPESSPIQGLNRITVGLKLFSLICWSMKEQGLNRITVGLKLIPWCRFHRACHVWIESRWDWNVTSRTA